jgi:predicted DNA-binding transcriptional regulator AlpA
MKEHLTNHMADAMLAHMVNHGKKAMAGQTFLRFADLQARGIVGNRETLARWVRIKHFPPGIQMGPGIRAWPESEVQQWLESRPLAGNPVKTDAT